jgi:hypothetical protein
MIRKIYSLLIIVLLSCLSGHAQDGYVASGAAGNAFSNLFTIGWDVNIPTGNKYVSDISWAGGKLEYRKMLDNDKNISIGFDLSWNSFFEYKTYQTYHISDNTDITTDLYKYNYTLPMALTVHKYFKGNGIFIPYFGLGLGATYSRPSLIFNIYEIYDDNWGFLARPELGTIIKFDHNSDVGLLLGARYSFSTNQAEGFRIDNLESIGFNLGVCWLY